MFRRFLRLIGWIPRDWRATVNGDVVTLELEYAGLGWRQVGAFATMAQAQEAGRRAALGCAHSCC